MLRESVVGRAYSVSRLLYCINGARRNAALFYTILDNNFRLICYR